MKRTFVWAGFAVFCLLFMLSWGKTSGPLFAEGTRERLVLLPIEGETLSDGDKALFQNAIKEGLSGRYEIFSGEQVEAKLQKFAVTSCTSDECLENIAIAFNGNLVGRGSVTREGADTYISIEIKDVITDKDVLTKTDGCVGCSKTEVMKKLKAMAGGRSASSSGGAVEFASPTAPDRGPAEGAVTRITPKVSGDSGSKVAAQVKIKEGGDKFTNSIGMSFVFINPGTFMMGSPSGESGRGSDETLHQVTLTRGYYMQTTEVTQGQWRRVMGNNPSEFNNCGDDCPVEQVSWEDAQKFIRKLNQIEKHNRYRLPTEAEWEYACRAGTTTPFSTGDCMSTDQANYDGNYPLIGCVKGQDRKTTTRAGSFEPNAWGLYDMNGNVCEWCQDWKGDYPSGAVSDPEGPSSGQYRVLRGGKWVSNGEYCRSASRSGSHPGGRFSSIGFRLALSPGQ